MRALHAFVSGVVQGVWFRQATRRMGRSLGLMGWVRNLPDGRVEVFAQGEDDQVEQLLQWLWAGPPGATVSGVESHDVATDSSLQDFLIVN